MPETLIGAAMIRNVIFDWSGTLVDDLPAVWEATNHVLRQAGAHELSLEEFRSEFSLPFSEFYERILPEVSMDRIEASFHHGFKQAQHSVVDLPHARDFLTFAKANRIQTFVLSTLHPEYYAVQIEALGLEGLIDHPYLGIWDKRARIEEILTAHELVPSETLFVGDMQHDIETAKRGRVCSCAVLTGYNRYGQLLQSEPDVIVEHLGELKRLLQTREFQLLPTSGPEEGMPDQPVATVGALIFNEVGEVLMIRTQKWSDLWGIPGGKIRYGETIEAALHREIKEETDLTVTDSRFVMVQDCIESKEFYRKAHFLLLNYTCQASGNDGVRLNQEAQAFCWVAPQAAFDLNLNTPTRKLLEAVLQDERGGASHASEFNG